MIAATNLSQAIKKAAMDAVRASKPADLATGTVTSAKPLKIKLSQKMTLTEDFIYLTCAVSDYKTETSSTKDGQKSTVWIHNGLKKGDKVVMVRAAGGQKYLVIDKVVET